MRYIFTSLLFVLLSLSAVAQTNKYIVLSSGLAVPTGEFGSLDFRSDKSGFAIPDPFISLSFGNNFGGKRFGLATMVQAQANSLSDAFKENIAQDLIQSSIQSKSTPWKMRGIYLGTFTSFPLSEKVSFNPRLMLGYLYVTSPSMKVNYGLISQSFYLQNKNSSAFGCYLGGHFQFDLGTHVALQLGIDYLYTNPQFVKVEHSYFDQPTEYLTYRRKITTVNVTAGFGIRF